MYDYEVTIYDELNGSDEWNGSVLGVMLIMGTFGAMLPPLLDRRDQSPHDSWFAYSVSATQSPGNSPNDSYLSSHRNSDANSRTASTHASWLPSPGTELTAALRVIISSILACASLLLFVISWQLVASIFFLALFFAFWQFIHVITFTRLALLLKTAQLEAIDAESTTRDASDHAQKVLAGKHAAHSILIEERPHHYITPVVRTLPSVLNEFVDVREDEDLPLSGTKKPVSPSRKIGEPPHLTAPDKKDTNEVFEKRRAASALTTDAPEPPYSFAVVAVIAVNALVQIVLQAILFSGLQLGMRAASWILVFVFCAATAAFGLYSVYWFGSYSINTGLLKTLNFCSCGLINC